MKKDIYVSTLPIRNGNGKSILADLSVYDTGVSTLPIRNGNNYIFV